MFTVAYTSKYKKKNNTFEKLTIELWNPYPFKTTIAFWQLLDMWKAKIRTPISMDLNSSCTA